MVNSQAAARRGSSRPAQALCRLIFNYRLVALSVAVLWVAYKIENIEGPLIALTVAAIASFLPIKLWDRVGPVLLAHPLLLAMDLALGMAILTVMGPESPFFYFTLGTALLSGVLYEYTGALVFSFALIAVYWAMLWFRAEIFDELGTFLVVIGLPALYPLAALGGGAVRRLLDRMAATEGALLDAVQSKAIESERARLAREMHDSLAKTIHGLALSAAALPAWVKRDPERAGAEARSISEAAEAAATEARELIQNLRSNSLDVSLGEAVAALARDWSARTGVPVDVEAVDADDVSAEARWEVFCIAKEALANAERHGYPGRVRVTLAEELDDLRLEVSDDGRGFDVPEDLGVLQRDGHFGLVGMAERAKGVGGRLQVDARRGRGTTIRVVVPARSDKRPPADLEVAG